MRVGRGLHIKVVAHREERRPTAPSKRGTHRLSGTGLSSQTHPECISEPSSPFRVRAGIAYLAFKAAAFLAKMALATPLLARLVAAAREMVGL